jgi:hypothetical protein
MPVDVLAAVYARQSMIPFRSYVTQCHESGGLHCANEYLLYFHCEQAASERKKVSGGEALSAIQYVLRLRAGLKHL